MGLTHPISAWFDPDILPFADIYGFDGYETWSSEMESFINVALTSFAKHFTDVSMYYVQDCLRKYKMAISWKLADLRVSLLPLS